MQAYCFRFYFLFVTVFILAGMVSFLFLPFSCLSFVFRLRSFFDFPSIFTFSNDFPKCFSTFGQTWSWPNLVKLGFGQSWSRSVDQPREGLEGFAVVVRIGESVCLRSIPRRYRSHHSPRKGHCAMCVLTSFEPCISCFAVSTQVTTAQDPSTVSD